MYVPAETRPSARHKRDEFAHRNLGAHDSIFRGKMANAKQQENMLLTEHFTWPPIVCIASYYPTHGPQRLGPSSIPHQIVRQPAP